MGRGLDADLVVQRSRRETARWRIARGEIRQRLFCLHRPRVVPAVTGRRLRRLSSLRQHGLSPRSEMTEHDRPPFFATWSKAYWFAIALFALEVALLYAFTLRFS